ncbi:hypothetical protein N7492_010548 [Penicillium capsulatum]|uniref:Rho-GAP domain-containing protein n=1 Tax=Penicillium capsulatum TaxID=69766 RepID=A0A9W9HLD7_9EURO|nr:hypothetical protein N7492_010548 [Penicillium capsulatum]KAJ6113050.1 hypothetical protein N7512_008374 [Penicillium capsulatum]
MPSLRALFRPSKPISKSAQPRSRATWPRLRRIQSAGTPLNNKPDEHQVSNEDAKPAHVEQREGEKTSVRQNSGDNKEDQHGISVLDESEPAHAGADASSLSQSQHGSKRLKNIMARFRSSKSQDQSSASETMLLVSSQNVTESQTTTDPVKKDPPSRHPSNAGREGQEQQRNVSAQTAVSQESTHSAVTVCRHSSQRIQDPIPESPADWLSQLLNFDEGAHFPESSDPFSDGKDIEPRRMALASSKYSEEPEIEPVRESSKHSQCGSTRNLSHKSQVSSRDRTTQRSSRTSSGSSRASRGSRISRLDPARATKAFNVLAKKSGLQFRIKAVEPATGHAGDRCTSEDSGPQRRYRFLTRVRPVQSTMTLSEGSQAPVSKLRRTKTFANLARRPDPMIALQGRTLETLSRLGGHSFLMLPADLAPAPLQLPACIVATMQYLRRFGSTVPDLFSEPGDIKTATRLYDHFASQVLSAEKEEAKIAMTMRVIAMPSLDDPDPTVVLSVGWVLKALLAGLPDGILGSDRLYQALVSIFRADLEIVERIRLVTLAIVALTSEMQCALVCAVFALLTALLPTGQDPSISAIPRDPEHADGIPDRPVAPCLQADRLFELFGPLLLGTSTHRDPTVQPNVQRAYEELLVVRLVQTHWREVSGQLRGWASL